MGGVMSKFERLLVAGSTELPDCRCATEMHLTAIVPVPGGDTEIRMPYRTPHARWRLKLQQFRQRITIIKSSGLRNSALTPGSDDGVGDRGMSVHESRTLSADP